MNSASHYFYCPLETSCVVQTEYCETLFYLLAGGLGRLTTRDGLRRWGMNVPEDCLLCGLEAESLEHLFFGCDYSKAVWDFFFSNSPFTPPSLFEEILRLCIAPSSNHKLNLICKLLLQATVYELWKERNSRLHNSNSRPFSQIIKDIQLIIRAKMAVLDRSSTPSPHGMHQENKSFLYLWFQYYQRNG